MNLLIATALLNVLVFSGAVVLHGNDVSRGGRVRRRQQLEAMQTGAQRRQGYEYSTSIVHQSPGQHDQHAQSEIKVSLENVRMPKYNAIINQPKLAPQVYQKYDLTKPVLQLYQANKQQGYFDVGQNTALQQAPGDQNTFNVGYSIGFGNTDPKPAAATAVSSAAPTLQLPTNQRTNYKTDIVTGTPTAKVAKPIRIRIDNHQDAKDYVLSAIQNYKKSPVEVSNHHLHKTSPIEVSNHHPLKTHYQFDQNTFNSFQAPQFAALTAPAVNKIEPGRLQYASTGTTPTNDFPVFKSGAVESYGWKNLSPGVEIAASTQHKPRSTTLTVTSPHTNGHSLLPAPADASATSTAVAAQHFDHAQAIGHSQGFDYTNAVNSDISHHTTSQNHPVLIDKTLLEEFYKNYKPMPLNWFNTQDAMNDNTDKEISHSETALNFKQFTQGGTNHQPNPFQLPDHVDTRLLLSNVPTQIDAALFQKAIANSNAAASPFQISTTAVQPSSNTNTFSFRQNVNTNPASATTNQHLQATSESQQPQPQAFTQSMQRQHHTDTQYSGPTANHRVSNAGPSYQSHQVDSKRDAPSASPHQMNIYTQNEQVIKGKPKKPGVVRHPRLLAAEQQQQHHHHHHHHHHQVTTSPQTLAVGVVRNISGQSAYNLNTALRPPPPGGNYMMKKEKY